MEKMAEKAEEWAGKMEWMSRKDGQVEVHGERQVSVGTPCKARLRACSRGMVAR